LALNGLFNDGIIPQLTRKWDAMALSPVPAGSHASGFAEMLREYMRAGTRPAGKRGTGAWSVQSFAPAIGVSSRLRTTGAAPRCRLTFLVSSTNCLLATRATPLRAKILTTFNKARGIEPPAGTVAIANIPVRVPTHFMGRDEPLALIHAALQRFEGRVAITALHGLRGVGKTVLAYCATIWMRKSDNQGENL
jgi:hypothetical protein